MILLDVVASVVLLLAAIAVVVQIIAGQASAHRAMQHKFHANELLVNIMEEQSILPWELVTPQSVAQLKLPREVEQLLPAAKLSATVEDSEGPPRSKKLSLELTWQTATGQRSQPIRLTTWLYPVSTEEALP